MGETGCGKTSLIRFLCTYVLEDYFEMFNIHAGVTESMIIDKVTSFVRLCKLDPQSDHWLVFDEFNTSDAHGMIKVIMLDRVLNGETIPCNAFVKNERGNWYVRGPVTVHIGSADNKTLQNLEITPKFYTIGGVDLYEAVQKKCGEGQRSPVTR